MLALLKTKNEAVAAGGVTHLVVSSHLLRPDADEQREFRTRPKPWVMAQARAGCSPKVPLGPWKKPS